MFGLILTLILTPGCDIERAQHLEKNYDELTLEQKIDILAWRTEVIAQVLLELDAKIKYIANNCVLKNKTHVSNTTPTK